MNSRSITFSDYDPQPVLTTQRRTHRKALLRYLNDRLTSVDWCRSERLAEDTWRLVLERGGVDLSLTQPGSPDPESGLPGWLAFAAREVLRRYLSPMATRTVTTVGAPSSEVAAARTADHALAALRRALTEADVSRQEREKQRRDDLHRLLAAHRVTDGPVAA